MRKIYFITMLFGCLMGQAQKLFTLEKTLDGQYSIMSSQYDDDDNFVDQLPFVNLSAPPCDMGFYYYTACSGNKLTINLVSPNYEVSKTEYYFELPSGYELQSSYPTSKLTSDKSLMFFNVGRNGSLQSCGLYNANGKLVQSFAIGVYYATVYPFIYRVNGEYKLLVWKGSLSGTTIKYTTDVYKFNGPTTQIQDIQEKRQVHYRSANDTVTIPFSNNNNHFPLLVVDSNGTVIESQQLNVSEGDALIHIGTYRPGVYIYKIGEQTGKFVVN